MVRIMFLSLLMFIGCMKQAEKVETKGNYKVELLFENDGCKVYRFYDGRYVYYTDCSGKISYEQRSKNRTTIIENNTGK